MSIKNYYKKIKLNDVLTSESESDIDSVNGVDDNITNGNTIEYEKMSFKANYLLFGTYLSYCHNLEMNGSYLRLDSITPNILGIGFKYQIRIAFSDIIRLLYCSKPTNSLIFLELNKRSGSLIQMAMNLGHNSVDGLKYDVDSDDVVDRYIVIDVEENSYPLVIQRLTTFAKTVNNQIIIKIMSEENASRYLRQNYRKCVASHQMYRKKLEIIQNSV